MKYVAIYNKEGFIADRGARMRVGLMESRGEKAGVGVRCPFTEWSELDAEALGAVDE